MARDQAMDLRLRRWAEWKLNGDGAGFPAISVLHKEWLPPVAGATPSLRISGVSDVAQTHVAIGELGVRLRDAIVVHYLEGGPIERQAERLGCVPATVHARVNRAHVELRAVLDGGFCNNDKVE